MSVLRKPQKINMEIISETLYLAVVALYILKEFLSGTLFNIPWPKYYDCVLRVLMCGVLLLRLKYIFSYAKYDWLICILTCSMFLLSWKSTGYSFLLDTALLSMGAAGIQGGKIIKTGFWTCLDALMITVMGSILGCIPDRIYCDSNQLRHSFGIVYPTDFSAHVTFLALTGWALYGGIRIFPSLLGMASLAAFVYFFCDAKCSTIVLLLAFFAVLYWGLTEKYKEKSRAADWLIKWGNQFLVWVFLFCAVLMCGLSFFYSPTNTWMTHIDALLSTRLNLGHMAIEKYGVKLFGTAFEQIGFGGGTAWSWALEYNFLDCSYVLILVRYGLMVLTALCIQYMWLEKNFIKNGQRKLAIAAALIAIHSIAEHHLPELAYNLFLLLPFANFHDNKHKEKIPSLNRKAKCTVFIVILSMGLILYIAFPKIVSCLKTIVDLLHWDTPEKHILFIVFFGAALLAISNCGRIVLKLAASYKNIVRFRINRRQSVMKAVIAIGLVMILFFAAANGELAIRYGRKIYQERLEMDSAAIETLLSATDGNLYIDHLPEIYCRRFAGISPLTMTPEGMAPCENTTLILEDDAEQHVLLDFEYQYGSLPSGLAIYTNSEAVLNASEKAGIRFTKFYNRQTTLDLKALAVRNNLDLTESGGLLLKGYEKSLWHGLGHTIYSGTLRVEYKLHLISRQTDGAADKVAAAKVSSDWGMQVLKQKEIYLEDFDENGQYICTLDIHLMFSCPNMEFLLLVPDGVELEIEQITYRKIDEG